MGAPPAVSIVIPAFRSATTIGACLGALRRQTWRDFEVLVVDSSPDAATAEVVGHYPEVRIERSPRRLLPHAARNRGVELARADVLVFSDPDVYARPDWLAMLLGTHRATGDPVAGALACHGQRWLDLGIHLTKFANWLPGGAPREADSAASANLLCTRARFHGVGGFRDDVMAGDTLFTWRLREQGPLRFEPRAVVAHHHLSGWGDFLRERFARAVEFGAVRSAWHDHGRRHDLLYLVVSALPARLGKVLLHTAGRCREAGLFGCFLRTLPVIVAGHAASLAGESTAYLRRLRRPALPAPGGSARERRARED
jgi:glycosyltransferase involved in cell wall biosynthesis